MDAKEMLEHNRAIRWYAGLIENYALAAFNKDPNQFDVLEKQLHTVAQLCQNLIVTEADPCRNKTQCPVGMDCIDGECKSIN